MRRAEGRKSGNVTFDRLMSIFDKSIIRVDNSRMEG